MYVKHFKKSLNICMSVSFLKLWSKVQAAPWITYVQTHNENHTADKEFDKSYDSEIHRGTRDFQVDTHNKWCIDNIKGKLKHSHWIRHIIVCFASSFAVLAVFVYVFKTIEYMPFSCVISSEHSNLWIRIVMTDRCSYNHTVRNNCNSPKSQSYT